MSVQESIFIEEEPQDQYAVRRRYWVVIVVLLIAHTSFLVYKSFCAIGHWSGSQLFIQDFNSILNLGETVYALSALFLFLRKHYWGWITVGIMVSYWTVFYLQLSVFFLKRGDWELSWRLLLLLVLNLIVLIAIKTHVIRVMYNVPKRVVWLVLGVGALVAVALITFEMLEPYWRMHHAR